jgi:nucleotide-binding universal stress UspA family protein
MSLFKTDRVLVPIDFSEASFKAQEEALEFVHDPANIYVLYVLPSLYPGEPGVTWNTVDNQTRIAKVQEKFDERFNDPKHEGMHFHVEVGDPSSVILDFAAEKEATLIVISSHGRTGLNRFLMGSVSERVVRFAKCPVLVIRR